MIETGFVKQVFVEDGKLLVIVKDDTGFEEEAVIYGNSSVESRPLVGDEVAFVEAGNENIVIASYRAISGINGGESRIYSRDSNGNTKASIVLDKNGVVNVNGGGDSAALTSKVDDFIAKIDNMFRTWTPVPSDGGAALKSIFTTSFPSAPATVESETLKVDK